MSGLFEMATELEGLSGCAEEVNELIGRITGDLSSVEMIGVRPYALMLGLALRDLQVQEQKLKVMAVNLYQMDRKAKEKAAENNG